MQISLVPPINYIVLLYSVLGLPQAPTASFVAIISISISIPSNQKIVHSVIDMTQMLHVCLAP